MRARVRSEASAKQKHPEAFGALATLLVATIRIYELVAPAADAKGRLEAQGLRGAPEFPCWRGRSFWELVGVPSRGLEDSFTVEFARAETVAAFKFKVAAARTFRLWSRSC